MTKERSFKKAKFDKRLKISDEIITKIENCLKAGAYVETAAAVAGVSKVSFYAWLKKGHKQPSSIYGKLLNAIEKAQADAEMRDLLNIDSSAMGRKFVYERDDHGRLVMNSKGDPIVINYGSHPSWQASAWRLERKNPKKWGHRERIDISEAADDVPDGETSEDRLKRIVELQKKLKLIDE